LHILTGLIATALLGYRKKSNRSPLLSLKGPVETKHLLPGRVRFHVPCLKNDEAKRDLLEEKLGGIESVESVRITASTGSLLIQYDEKHLEPELLFAAIIRLLGLERALERTPQPALFQEYASLIRSLDRAVYDRTHGLLDFHTTVSFGLATLGLMQLLTRSQRILPPGFHLLWWGYMGLSQELRARNR